ncbi:hypothetical protein Hanom_Chr09g00845691 [Helianthus anomalus]
MEDDEEDSPIVNSVSDEENPEQEIPVASPETSHAAEEVQRFESVIGSENVERRHNYNIGGGDIVSDSENAGEPLMQSCGSQGNKGGNWVPYFFSSTGNGVGPKKRKPILRPRSKSQVQHERSSPSTCERPKKRARDNGEYLVDLNLDPTPQAQDINSVEGDSQRQPPLACSKLVFVMKKTIRNWVKVMKSLILLRQN